MHDTRSLVRPNALRGICCAGAAAASARPPARARPAPTRPAVAKTSRRSGPVGVGSLTWSVTCASSGGSGLAGFPEHLLNLLLGGVQGEAVRQAGLRVVE